MNLIIKLRRNKVTRKEIANKISITIFVVGLVWFLTSFYYPEVWVKFTPNLDPNSDGLPILTGSATIMIMGIFLLFPGWFWLIGCIGLHAIIAGEKL